MANTGNADQRKTGPGDIDPGSHRHGNGVGRTMAWYSSLEEVRRAETELERYGNGVGRTMACRQRGGATPHR
jgi:hypothetical protein